MSLPVQHFSDAVNPAVSEGIRFMLEDVPHERGYCFVAFPLSVRSLYDDWAKRTLTEFEHDFQAGKQPAVGGIACPASASGFFCVQVRDSKPDIDEFLKEMQMLGTEDFLILRRNKKRPLALQAIALK